MKKTVSTSGARTRLLWASCISISKSLMARRPRTMEPAPRARQKSTVRPSKEATSIAGRASRRPREGVADDPDPRLDGEQRRLARVREDADDDRVEDDRGAADDVEVAVGDRVERARVDRDGSSSSARR